MNKEQVKIVEEAMDIHASRMAVEFAKWLNKNQFHPSDILTDIWQKKGVFGALNSTELYNIFLKQIAIPSCKNENQDASAS